MSDDSKTLAQNDDNNANDINQQIEETPDSNQNNGNYKIYLILNNDHIKFIIIFLTNPNE